MPGLFFKFLANCLASNGSSITPILYNFFPIVQESLDEIETKPHRNGSAVYKMPVQYKECSSGDFVCKNVHECIQGQ